MKKVWKVNLDAGFNTFDLPAGCKFLHVAVQHNMPAAWVLVDDEQPFEKVSLIIAGTGHPLPDNVGEFVGTFMSRDGSLVFHVFEEAK